jgi:c(7)-type cytochrome triheme protein
MILAGCYFLDIPYALNLCGKESIDSAFKNCDKSAILGMPDIVFSQKIHAVQNGCELCHPEIFDAKKGETKYSMQDIFAGKYCGACHEKVAFPFYDCQLCHMKPVY